MKKTVGTNSVEYYASFFGAILLSLGLGAMFAEFVGGYSIFLIVTGLILHAFGMYKVYR